MLNNICIIGAGAYGCALAQVLSEKLSIFVLSADSGTKDYINNFHSHPSCLKDITLNHSINCVTDYEFCLKCDAMLIATPVSAIREICETLKRSNLSQKTPIILCSKGIELESGLFTSEIASAILPHNDILVLSGPSFANEIAYGLPACVSLSCSDIKVSEYLSRKLSTSSFHIRCNSDIIGTQVCGALKNVLAILCGILHGRCLGRSFVSYLITYALKEMGNYIEKLGGNKSTVYEVCGLGDVILTCTNEFSRNMSFGQFISQCGTIDTWNGNLAEGAFTANVIPLLERRCENLKIFRLVYEAVYESKSIDIVVDELITLLKVGN